MLNDREKMVFFITQISGVRGVSAVLNDDFLTTEKMFIMIEDYRKSNAIGVSFTDAKKILDDLRDEQDRLEKMFTFFSEHKFPFPGEKTFGTS